MTTPPSPTIAPATGRLGVLTVGLGAVASTLIAGVELVKRGMGAPVGSLTQMGTIRLGKRTDDRSPLIKDFVPLADARRHRVRRMGPVPRRRLRRGNACRCARGGQAHRGCQPTRCARCADAGGVRPGVREAHRRRQHDAHDQQARRCSTPFARTSTASARRSRSSAW